MTERRLRIFALLLGSAIGIHLLSYNLWRWIEEQEKQMYVYCILNSMTHMAYSIALYYSSYHYHNKLKSRFSYGLRLATGDWCLFGLLDVYNQFIRNYDSQLAWQWIGFFIVLLFDTYKISKWNINKNNRQ